MVSEKRCHLHEPKATYDVSQRSFNSAMNALMDAQDVPEERAGWLQHRY